MFKARGLVYHSALGLRVIKKTKKLRVEGGGNMYEGIGGDGKKGPALPPATSVLRTNSLAFRRITTRVYSQNYYTIV